MLVQENVKSTEDNNNKKKTFTEEEIFAFGS